jgi:hypothetical protein
MESPRASAPALSAGVPAGLVRGTAGIAPLARGGFMTRR